MKDCFRLDVVEETAGFRYRFDLVEAGQPGTRPGVDRGLLVPYNFYIMFCFFELSSVLSGRYVWIHLVAHESFRECVPMKKFAGQGVSHESRNAGRKSGSSSR